MEQRTPWGELSGWDQPFRTEDMVDTEFATKQLAVQAPWWEPGTASGYHAQNQGHPGARSRCRTAAAPRGRALPSRAGP